jgi:phage replication-related protein YjqB (UPF0714/DUF867 family)
MLLSHPEVVETVALRSNFGFMAFHAGLEAGTGEVAGDAAARCDASLYTVTQPDELRWHVPSALVDPVASDRLRDFLDHVTTVITIHGYGRHSRPRDVLVGGGNRDLAAHVAATLRDRLPGFMVFDDLAAIPIELRGLHPDNPVNRATCGGAQVELPPAARRPVGLYDSEASALRATVASALAEAAAAWPLTEAAATGAPASTSEDRASPARDRCHGSSL